MERSYTCQLCGEPVDPTKRSTHILVQGWLPRNIPGGGGQVRLRQQVPGHFAHEVCVVHTQRGIPVTQGRLV